MVGPLRTDAAQEHASLGLGRSRGPSIHRFYAIFVDRVVAGLHVDGDEGVRGRVSRKRRMNLQIEKTMGLLGSPVGGPAISRRPLR